MKVQGTFRSAVLTLLIVLLVFAAVEAKLGLYQPDRSPAHITSQAIKLKEVKLERVAPLFPVATVVLPVTYFIRSEPRPAEPDFAAPTPPDISGALWFRPPPALI